MCYHLSRWLRRLGSAWVVRFSQESSQDDNVAWWLKLSDGLMMYVVWWPWQRPHTSAQLVDASSEVRINSADIQAEPNRAGPEVKLLIQEKPAHEWKKKINKCQGWNRVQEWRGSSFDGPPKKRFKKGPTDSHRLLGVPAACRTWRSRRASTF